jgi:hypothetical protein
MMSCVEGRLIYLTDERVLTQAFFLLIFAACCSNTAILDSKKRNVRWSKCFDS